MKARKDRWMSMSSWVEGIKPPDRRWQQMKAVYDTCLEADIPLPKVVADYFEWEEPDPNGVKIELPVREWRPINPKWAAEGYELDVADIPPDVKTIRFVNSW